MNATGLMIVPVRTGSGMVCLRRCVHADQVCAVQGADFAARARRDARASYGRELSQHPFARRAGAAGQLARRRARRAATRILVRTVTDCSTCAARSRPRDPAVTSAAGTRYAGGAGRHAVPLCAICAIGAICAICAIRGPSMLIRNGCRMARPVRYRYSDSARRAAPGARAARVSPGRTRLSDRGARARVHLTPAFASRFPRPVLRTR